MHLKIKGQWVKSLSKTWKEEAGWHHDEQWRDYDIDDFSAEDLGNLERIAGQHLDVKGSRAILQKIKSYRGLRSNVKGQKIIRLEDIVVAMKVLLSASTTNKWLFTENEDGHLIPWYVYHVKYKEADPTRMSPAQTVVDMAAVRQSVNITMTLSFGSEDRKGTMVEMLESKGYFLESEMVKQQYAEEVAYYNAICQQTGAQFNAFGNAFDLAERYGRTLETMERDGEPTKVVMDDLDGEGGAGDHHSAREQVTGAFWSSKKSKREGEDDDEVIVRLPLQPYVKVFDLTAHRFLLIHACDLKPYVWDNTLMDKLVLPTEHKDLVQMLVTGADLVMEDIVKGKTGGIIVISTGPPGTGKTLTAEVFSEGVKKPLYKVQCSQLGTNENALEEHLQTVLARAERWKAILLIDEADVYVYQRGNDIQQNAIVGVFLRILEYYRGILFLTSNRETVIDDAILSRATAWIRYDLPDTAKLKRIWRVLAAQFQIPLSEAHIKALTEDTPEFEHISGRSVKNLLKLARLLAAQKNESVTPKMVRYVAQFLDLESSKTRETNSARKG